MKAGFQDRSKQKNINVAFRLRTPNCQKDAKSFWFFQINGLIGLSNNGKQLRAVLHPFGVRWW
jgi:hypothetical protein